MKDIKVKDVMTSNPVLIAPDATLQEAAELMQFIDCGLLPVGTREELEGVITDRDIVIRAIAKGENPMEAKVGDFMTSRICACHEDDTLEEAAEKLRKFQVSRLLVKNAGGRVTGVLSFGIIMRKKADPAQVAAVVKNVAS